MYRTESPFIVDFYVVSLRWIFLLGTTISLSLVGQLLQPANLLLILFVAWNLFQMWLAGQSQRLIRHREISLGFDLSLAVSFSLLSSPSLLTIFLILLLPISTAALYYNLKGSLLTTFPIALLHIIDSSLPVNQNFAMFYTLVYGFLFGLTSQYSYNQIQKNRLWQIQQREKQHIAETTRIRTIYNLSTTLTSMLSYNRVLDAALDLSVDALSIDSPAGRSNSPDGIESIVSVVLLHKNDVFEIASSRQLTATDKTLVFSGNSGILNEVRQVVQPLVFDSTRNDPELTKIESFASCNSFYCLPMVSGYDVYGIMLFGHPQKGYFTQERCDILGIVGRQALVAIQNAKLYQDISDEKEKIAEVEEETRKKLARDLHDGPTQSVTAIAMRVNLARRMLSRDPVMTSEELVKIEDLARRTTKEIRHMLFTLRPIILETEGLAAAVRAIAEKMKEMYDKNVIIKLDEKIASRIDLSKSGVIFFIIDEAVNNARKHANAEHVWITITTTKENNDIVDIEVKDDGIGFDLVEVNKSYDKRGSLGLINLKERTEMLNGVLNIVSAPDKGTTIHLRVPLSDEAANILHNHQHKTKNT
jgi:signal transduction histidine kinase